MSGEAVFRIEGVRKSFGPVTVLQGVDLDLKAGAVTVLMGANGTSLRPSASIQWLSSCREKCRSSSVPRAS